MLKEEAEPPSTTSRPTCGATYNFLNPPAAPLTAPLHLTPKKLPALHRFPLGLHTREFKKKFYPDASVAEWNDWKWQVRHRIKSLNELARVIQLSDDER